MTLVSSVHITTYLTFYSNCVNLSYKASNNNKKSSHLWREFVRLLFLFVRYASNVLFFSVASFWWLKQVFLKPVSNVNHTESTFLLFVYRFGSQCGITQAVTWYVHRPVTTVVRWMKDFFTYSGYWDLPLMNLYLQKQIHAIGLRASSSFFIVVDNLCHNGRSRSMKKCDCFD